jgi:alanine dehydrogenase
MDFGIPKEVRDFEYRVGLTPGGVYALAGAGNTVFVESGAGAGAGFSDEDYRKVGAEVRYSPDEVYGRAAVVLKVARLAQREYAYLQKGQTVLSFLHFAVASRDLGETLAQMRMTAIAYEMIERPNGDRPVLRTTSQVAGRMAPIIAGQYLEAANGGRGILLGGIPGVPSAEVVILGAGVVGLNAAAAFAGLGAQVTVLDQNYERLEAAERALGRGVVTVMSSAYAIQRAVRYADVVVGAVLEPGRRAPVLLTRAMLREMRPRAVLIDFAIDQGGCAETSRPTTHQSPTYMEEGVIHYAVPNVPARVPRTASHALTNAALPYLVDIGALGVEAAIEKRPGLRRGLQVFRGEVQP